MNTKAAGERLRKFRKALKLTQIELAKILDISKTTLRRYERGESEITKTLAYALNALFGLNPDWLLYGKGKMFFESMKVEQLEKKVNRVPLRAVPVINTNVPAGFPDMPLENLEVSDYIYLPAERIPENSICVRVRGDSMSPEIKDGDYVLFVPAGIGDLKNGDIVIVMNEWNELMIKRFRVKNGEIYLVSDNPEYPTFKPNEAYKIVGKVIKRITIKNL